MTNPSRSDLDLPLELETSLLRILAIEDELTEKMAASKRIESRVALDLTAAKDDKGKLILTNDKQREAAVAEYLGQDEAFLKLYGESKRLQREKLEVQASLERTRIEIKYDLLKRESENLVASIRLADALWQARHGSGFYKPGVSPGPDINDLSRSLMGDPAPAPAPAPAPEFFRGPGLHIIPDSEAGAEDDVVCPF